MDRIAFIYEETFVYWSAILQALGVVTALCLFVGLHLWKSGNVVGTALAVPLCLVSGLTLSRLVHWYCLPDGYESLRAALVLHSPGGYALMGAFAGCALTACLLRLLGAVKNLPRMLDCMVLAGAGGIAVGRLSSLFNASGRGMVLQGLTSLPLAYPVRSEVTGQEEYRLAVFMLQAMVAAALLGGLAVYMLLRGKKYRDGDVCLLFFLFYGASQAVLDSIRYDSLFFQSNGFVSIVQILGAVSVAVVTVIFSVRALRATGWRWYYPVCWTVFAAGLGGAGYMEYYVQRHGDRAPLAYSVMTACLVGAVLAGLLPRWLSGKRKKEDGHV